MTFNTMLFSEFENNWTRKWFSKGILFYTMAVSYFLQPGRVHFVNNSATPHPPKHPPHSLCQFWLHKYTPPPHPSPFQLNIIFSAIGWSRDWLRLVYWDLIKRCQSVDGCHSRATKSLIGKWREPHSGATQSWCRKWMPNNGFPNAINLLQGKSNVIARHR